MIDQLITALSKEVEMSAEEIADTIWLALQMQEFQAESVSFGFPLKKEDERAINEQESQPNQGTSPKTSELEETPTQPPEEQKAGIYPRTQQQTSKSLDLSFKVPDAPSLREPLTLARALKPLMRRIPSGRELVLDEAATIQRIADEGLWIPVLKPTVEPWLDLELVVDEAISMQIWRHTIRELERLLKNYGIFRDVRVWGLITDENEQVQIRRGIGATAKNQTPRSPKELIDPSGRRLVLVVSDCVSSVWRNGGVTPVLELWAKQGSMAIVQMLPKWLWKRTALGRASEVRLRGLTPGVSNQKLIAKEVSLWDELEEERGVKVPVFTLEADKVVTWAQMVSGKGSIWTLGYVFKLDATPVQKESELFNLAYGDLSAEQRVQAFRVTASPMARKLAGLLASAPVISLPIVRLIREALLKDSQQFHVAEVFLGGLLKPLSEINIDTNPDYVQYDFMDGVRELLVDSVPSMYVLNVVDEVSKYVAKKVGLSLGDFAAVLRSPQQDSGNTGGIDYFATITAQVLRRLGGEYLKIADSLTNDLQINIRNTSSKTTQTERISRLNEAKIILVGNGAVGKTSLVMRLIDLVKPYESKTEGIDIRHWTIKAREENVRLRFLDFGGQEIFHATHQFFLTERSLYLLVLNTRMDESENNVEYWLKIIESFGKDAPVLVIGNKSDEHPLDLNRRYLQDKYPNIQGFFETSCKTGMGIDKLRDAIVQQIAAMDHVFNVLPQQWFRLKEQIAKIDRDHISYLEYEQLCAAEEISDRQERRDLMRLLHLLGIVLNFSEDPRLQDIIVLNPEWITGGVYRILNDNLLRIEHKGILTSQELERILNPKTISDHDSYRNNSDRQFILDMMQKFEICFPIDTSSRNPIYLIPELLDKEEPDTGTWENTLNFEYHYKILFSSIISRFIVKMHHCISKRTYWRTGVILANKEGNRASVKADLTDGKVFIRIDGNPNTRRVFLSIIRNAFNSIHHSIPALEVDERVPLPDNSEVSVSYERLLILEQRGKTDYSPEGNDRDYNIRELLGGIEDRRFQDELIGSKSVSLGISFDDPSLDDYELEDETRKLLRDLKNRDDIETVERVRVVDMPEGSKSIGGFLAGLLTASISFANFKKVLHFLGDRLGNKPISFEVEVNGKKLKIRASSRDELEFAIKKAQEFIDS
ncbi:SAV_2336 N-terminal domain-related protein (plasmid) [Nostoc sp. UHCC 0926]|uniref:SAV_2336 N-terminal domain-related protein n=1 Tax=Nostoc sp. UHCC 0926 TaxID=3025190 RepID=UPI00235F36D3|nr:SAV_2336 N-terminal domain-related protein [Nostoc sp. UHCC 0926]WDD36284.1 SAV_2336 N-terminal domain-related protein [Nostoc sp. UHCC 0926]